jgi:hypothetical protein
MINKKRIRIPTSDPEGYDKEVVTNKIYLVRWDGNPSFAERNFQEYDDAYDFYQKHLDENPKIEEVVFYILVKTVLPKAAEQRSTPMI